MALKWKYSKIVTYGTNLPSNGELTGEYWHTAFFGKYIEIRKLTSQDSYYYCIDDFLNPKKAKSLEDAKRKVEKELTKILKQMSSLLDYDLVKRK